MSPYNFQLCSQLHENFEFEKSISQNILELSKLTQPVDFELTKSAPASKVVYEKSAPLLKYVLLNVISSLKRPPAKDILRRNCDESKPVSPIKIANEKSASEKRKVPEWVKNH